MKNMKTNRIKFNEFKNLIATKGDDFSKVLTEIAEEELNFLDKQFVEKNSPFDKKRFEVIWETSGLIDKSNLEKLMNFLDEKSTQHVLILMIMDVFLIVRSTYEFGDELHKTCPDKYEYKKAASIEELFEAVVNKRCYKV